MPMTNLEAIADRVRDLKAAHDKFADEVNEGFEGTPVELPSWLEVEDAMSSLDSAVRSATQIHSEGVSA